MTQLIKTAALVPNRALPHPVSPHARKGLRFEAAFARALRAAAPPNISVIPGPWFEYRRAYARRPAFCVPDIVLHDLARNTAVVIECKLTWTPLAQAKLDELYCPVVGLHFGCPTKALVVVKNLLPGCPVPGLTMNSALLGGLFQWDMRSRVVW